MRIDPGNIDKFAATFNARGWRPKPSSAPSRKQKVGKSYLKPTPPQPVETYDEEGIAPGTRLYKTQRERQIEAIENESRLFKKYLAARQDRLNRLASEIPGARKFLKALARIEPEAEATGYRDIDFDLASLARRCRLSEIPGPYDLFTIYEEAVRMVDRVARRSKRHTAPDPASFFTQGSMTTLDELKEELRLR